MVYIVCTKSVVHVAKALHEIRCANAKLYESCGLFAAENMLLDTPCLVSQYKFLWSLAPTHRTTSHHITHNIIEYKVCRYLIFRIGFPSTRAFFRCFSNFLRFQCVCCFFLFSCILTPRLYGEKDAAICEKEGKMWFEMLNCMCLCGVFVLVIVPVRWLCVQSACVDWVIVWKIFSSVAALLSKKKTAHMKIHGESMALVFSNRIVRHRIMHFVQRVFRIFSIE